MNRRAFTKRLLGLLAAPMIVREMLARKLPAAPTLDSFFGTEVDIKALASPRCPDLYTWIMSQPLPTQRVSVSQPLDQTKWSES